MPTFEPAAVWELLTTSRQPLPAPVLTAVIRAADATPFRTDGEVYGWPDAGLRYRLLTRSEVPLHAAARLAGWPDLHPGLTAAYLEHADHPMHTDPQLRHEVLSQLDDTTRIDLAVVSSNPATLTALGDIAATVPGNHLTLDDSLARNGWAPHAVRIAALRRLVDAGNLMEALNALTSNGTAIAAGVAAVSNELPVLTTALKVDPASEDIIKRLTAVLVDVVSGRVVDPTTPMPARRRDGRRPVAVRSNVATAIEELRSSAGREVLVELAEDLAALGLTVGDYATARDYVLRTDAWAARSVPLTSFAWRTLVGRAQHDAGMATELAALLDQRLGSTPDAWAVFATLQQTFEGTVEDLLKLSVATAHPAHRA